MDEQDVKIAVLETKIEGIRDQQRVHADNTDRKFERTFDYLKPISEWVQKNSDLPKEAFGSKGMAQPSVTAALVPRRPA